MKTVGITAEYNPFHKGHAYHISKVRQLAEADCVIAVMSGDFTQRGEPAVCGKWERARTAVSAPSGGVDLVIELPFAFACSRATVFAKGAVDMFAGLGVDCISFGCETEDPELLRNLAVRLAADRETIEERRLAYMKDGLSGAKAYELAVTEKCGREAAELLLEPNNILALEYLQRIEMWREKGHCIEAIPIRRYGSGYNDAEAGGAGFAGAGALRTMLKDGKDISSYVPAGADYEDVDLLSDRFLQLLKGIILRSTPEQISRIYGVGEGLENSIIREVRTAESMDGLITGLTSKRYTRATVSRALTHILLESTWNEIGRLSARTPSAGRLLAAGEAGRKFMREFDGDFRVITNINKEEEKLEPDDAELLKLDERAADMYNLLRGKDIYSASDRVARPYIE